MTHSIIFPYPPSLSLILLLSFMASLGTNRVSSNRVEIPIHCNIINVDPIQSLEVEESNNIDYSGRAQWLRAAVLGANDGLVSVASLMMGVGAIKEDVSAMLLAGFSGLVAGSCSMAIGEFVSVYTQYDIETAQIKRKREANHNNNNKGLNVNDEEAQRENLPNPFQAALASALAFSVGALVPLIAAVFIRNHKFRLAVVAAVAILALLVFGVVGAVLGKTPVGRSCFRMLIGGLMAMAITFYLTKFVGSSGL